MMRPSSSKASSSSLRLALRFCMGALPSFCKKSASRPIPVKEAWVMQTGKQALGSRERSQRPAKADLPTPFSPLRSIRLRKAALWLSRVVARSMDAVGNSSLLGSSLKGIPCAPQAWAACARLRSAIIVLGAIQLAIEMQIDQASQTVGLASVINFNSAHPVRIKAQLHFQGAQ